MKKPPPGTKLVNNYTRDTWEVAEEKSPRGGLYIMLRNVTGKVRKKGVLQEFHLGNLTSFTPEEP